MATFWARWEYANLKAHLTGPGCVPKGSETLAFPQALGQCECVNPVCVIVFYFLHLFKTFGFLTAFFMYITKSCYRVGWPYKVNINHQTGES